MNESILKFFKKNSISIAEIKYLTRENNKTCISMTDGRVIRTFTTAKDLFMVLAPYGFVSINKGTIVSKKYIDHIDNCEYHMTDGTILNGRKRTVSAHKHLGQNLHTSAVTASGTSVNIRSKFSILDNMPIAFCVVELLFNEDGHGIDFIFRYCNKEMEHLEGKSIEEMMDHSFYKVFPNADPKWLVAYTDVAINGTRRYIRDYSPEVDKELLIRCYQPYDGFCACLLTPIEAIDKSVQTARLQ